MPGPALAEAPAKAPAPAPAPASPAPLLDAFARANSLRSWKLGKGEKGMKTAMRWRARAHALPPPSPVRLPCEKQPIPWTFHQDASLQICPWRPPLPTAKSCGEPARCKVQGAWCEVQETGNKHETMCDGTGSMPNNTHTHTHTHITQHDQDDQDTTAPRTGTRTDTRPAVKGTGHATRHP